MGNSATLSAKARSGFLEVEVILWLFWFRLFTYLTYLLYVSLCGISFQLGIPFWNNYKYDAKKDVQRSWPTFFASDKCRVYLQQDIVWFLLTSLGAWRIITRVFKTFFSLDDPPRNPLPAGALPKDGKFVYFTFDQTGRYAGYGLSDNGGLWLLAGSLPTNRFCGLYASYKWDK